MKVLQDEVDMEEQRKIRKEIEERWKKLGLIEKNDELLKFDSVIKPLIGEVDDGKCDLKCEIMAEVLKHTSLDHIDFELKLEDNNK